jgi:hypothetical protein
MSSAMDSDLIGSMVGFKRCINISRNNIWKFGQCDWLNGHPRARGMDEQ